jgi:hypothetical protein
VYRYLTYGVAHWRHFLSTGYAIQGSIHSIALLVGCSVLKADDDTKAHLFKIYRLLNLAHFLTYRSRSAWLSAISDEDLVRLGLLKKDELEVLLPAGRKMRDNVITWVALEIRNGWEMGMLDTRAARYAVREVNQFRGKSAGGWCAREAPAPLCACVWPVLHHGAALLLRI